MQRGQSFPGKFPSYCQVNISSRFLENLTEISTFQNSTFHFSLYLDLIYNTLSSAKDGSIETWSHKTEHPELAEDDELLHRQARGPSVSIEIQAFILTVPLQKLQKHKICSDLFQ